MEENKSKLIATSLKRHSQLKRRYRSGKLTDSEFNNGLSDILNSLADLTDIFGDCKELDYVKEVVWFTVESFKSRSNHARPER